MQSTHTGLKQNSIANVRIVQGNGYLEPKALNHSTSDIIKK